MTTPTQPGLGYPSSIVVDRSWNTDGQPSRARRSDGDTIGEMARLCERPGCSIPASVLYGFEAAGAVVWLDAWSPDEPRRNLVGVLCRRHADALTPPRGWWLDDRRIAVPRLFDVPGEAHSDNGEGGVEEHAPDEPPPASEPSTPRSARKAKRKPGDVTEELSLPFLGDVINDGIDDAASAAETGIGTGTIRSVEDLPTHATAAPPGVQHSETTAEPATRAGHERTPPPQAHDVPDPDETRAMAWSPRFDRRDDLGGLLAAHSPLLSRAFGMRHPDN